MNTFASRALTCAFPVILAACSSSKLVEPPKNLAYTAPTTAAPAPRAASAPAPAAPMRPVLAAHLDPNNILYRERSVYFEYDGSALRDQDKRLIEAHGSYLARMPTLQVRIEGNTDERGSREYNLALGQRRAEAVKSALMVFGVRDSQVEAVSLGEEKPRAAGHDEGAWAQNRRADVVYPFAAK